MSFIICLIASAAGFAVVRAMGCSRRVHVAPPIKMSYVQRHQREEGKLTNRPNFKYWFSAASAFVLIAAVIAGYSVR